MTMDRIRHLLHELGIHRFCRWVLQPPIVAGSWSTTDGNLVADVTYTHGVVHR